MKKYALSMFLMSIMMPVTVAVEMGRLAPELQIQRWMNKAPVFIGEGKVRKIYVVEFWATWCPPCLSIIPYLSNIQAKYKDQGVVVVGITNEDESTVSKFLQQNPRINYHIAIDKQGGTNQVYMQGVENIPTAFVVDRQNIVVWRGHPMELDKVLPQVIAGTFDHLEYKKLGGLQEKFKLAMQMRQIDEASALAEEILYINPNDLPAMQLRLMLFQQQGQNTAAIAFLESLIRKFPGNESAYFIKLGLVRQEDPKKLTSCAEEIMDKFTDNALTMNRLAWDLLENGNFGNQPLGIALAAAEKGLKLTAKDDKPALAANSDTLARCYYSVGRIDKAIELQSRALAFAKGTDTEKMLQSTLDFYRLAEKLGAEIE